MGHWRLERRDRIAVATFSAPPRNFMTFADMTELEGLVEEVALDDAITVLVLASDVAGWFVAHGDLEDLLKLGRGEEFDGDALSWPRTLARFGSMPQIVVAAINGQAGGGGLEMTLACTLRVVGPRARLTFVEVAIGLIPGGGGTQRLPRIVGEAKALEMILRGLAVAAPRAYEMGIVHEIVVDPLARALEIGAELSKRGAEGLAFAKRLTRTALDRPLADGLADERKSCGAVMRTASAREGLRAGRAPAEIQKL
jgi:enoyl-CoA hydratase/carnithine racemase